MKTLTLNANEYNMLYNALRKELTVNDELVADAEHFPGEVDELTIVFAQEQAVMLNAMLDKLVAA